MRAATNAPVPKPRDMPEAGSAETSSPARNPMDAYLASLSPNGRRAMRERLRAVARLIGVEETPGVRPEEALRDHWHRLPFERVERIRQEILASGGAPSTVNLTLAALKGIARYARRFGLITLEEERNIREVAGAKGERPPAGGHCQLKSSRMTRRCLEAWKGEEGLVTQASAGVPVTARQVAKRSSRRWR